MEENLTVLFYFSKNNIAEIGISDTNLGYVIFSKYQPGHTKIYFMILKYLQLKPVKKWPLLSD